MGLGACALRDGDSHPPVSTPQGLTLLHVKSHLKKYRKGVDMTLSDTRQSERQKSSGSDSRGTAKRGRRGSGSRSASGMRQDLPGLEAFGIHSEEPAGEAEPDAVRQLMESWSGKDATQEVQAEGRQVNGWMGVGGDGGALGGVARGWQSGRGRELRGYPIGSCAIAYVTVPPCMCASPPPPPPPHSSVWGMAVTNIALPTSPSPHPRRAHQC